ncbi:type II toxin-antitoxin system VapC family toxin [Mesorhizobium sp. KR1-2]|uniref:type II toxin-antitoxin system VapC family toxin n=1 Tax=Mesorhizobium sp. KR1-2 TaxID=3156609 RepID=UPI0032B331D1
MIVLDTNIVSEVSHERSDPAVVAWLRAQDEAELCLCIPVVAELSFGAERFMLRNGNRKHLIAFERLVQERFRNRILPMDVIAASKYGEVYAAREAAGRPIGIMDAMIAAICLVNDATLATRNVRDFDGLDLKLVNPFEAGE